MNDRLRELMLEAGYAAPELAGRAIKLSELIIRECAQLTLDHVSTDYYRGWIDYRDEILEYFGVDDA